MEAGEEARCRLCARSARLAELHPVFPPQAHTRYSHARYTLALALCTGLQIQLDDGLPQSVCTECTEIINDSLYYRVKCHRAEIKLLKMGFKRKTCVNNLKEQRDKSSKDQNKYKSIYSHVTLLENGYTYNLSPQPEREAFILDVTDIKDEINSNETFSDNRDTDMGNKRNINELLNDKTKMSNGKYFIENIFPDSVVKDNALVLDLKSKRKEQKNKIKVKKSDDIIEHLLRNYKSRAKQKREKVKHLLVGPVDSKGPYQCKKCQKLFPRWSNFYWHTKIHTGFDYVCEHCGKKCINNGVLLRHLRSKHGLERDLCCQYCDFKGLDKMQMTLHVRARHTGERPFVCDACGASFTGKRLLIQHLPKHTDHRPVQCESCPSNFKTKHDLTVHRRKVHRPRLWRYECYICNNSFTRAQNAKTHVKKFHGIPIKEQDTPRKIRLE